MKDNFNKQSRLHFIKWLSELRKKDIFLVGGKGANLGELYYLGFPVPHGFCVTTEAFKYFAKRIKLEAKISGVTRSLNINDGQQLRKISRALREFILSQEIPVKIKKEVFEAYQIFSKKYTEPPWVAIRSSATTEDLPSASFAGQLDTYLNIRGEKNLIGAVLKCWASLFTERIILYREKAGFGHTDASMCVIVQDMVDSTKSGVMFTANPVTKDRNKILIEATIGLAESVVGGAATPDAYLIDKTTLKIIEKNIGSKKRIVLRNPIGDGVIKIETLQGQEMKPCLTTEEIRRVAELGRQIEVKYKNEPQDIEWAIEKDKFFILQTRPITTL